MRPGGQGPADQHAELVAAHEGRGVAVGDPDPCERLDLADVAVTSTDGLVGQQVEAVG